MSLFNFLMSIMLTLWLFLKENNKVQLSVYSLIKENTDTVNLYKETD